MTNTFGKPNLGQLLLNAPEIRTISLKDHGITFLEPLTFDPFVHLEDLDLQQNRLSFLDPLTFHGLRHLVKLNLSGNMIEALYPAVFSCMPALRVVYVQSNQVERFSERAFRNCPHLATLNLANNKLRSLGKLTFHQSEELFDLDLSRNKLCSLHPELLVDCRRLSTLWLNSNLIYELAATTFFHCVNLDLLSLASNKLRFLDPDLLSQCTKLKFLYLQDNPLGKVMLFISSQSLINVEMETGQVTFISYPKNANGDGCGSALRIDANEFKILDRWQHLNAIFEFFRETNRIKSLIEYYMRTNTLANLLQELIKRRESAILDQILSANAETRLFDVNACRDEHECTPLQYAIAHGYVEAVLILSAYNAELRGPGGLEALQLALRMPLENGSQRMEIIRILMKFVRDNEEAMHLVSLDETINEDLLHSMTSRRIRNLVFQGGGSRGIAYLGALDTLINEEEVFSLKRIKRFGGTSAGSICACLLGVGYELAELDDLFKEKLGIMELLDGDDDYKAEFFRLLEFNDKCQLLATGIRALMEFYRTKSSSTATAGSSIARFIVYLVNQFKPPSKSELLERNLMTKQGIFSGARLRSVIDQLIRAKTAHSNTTFGQLDDLVKRDPATFKHVFITGVDLRKQRTHVFSHLHSRNVTLADAVRISASIPIIFEPFELSYANSRTQAQVTGLFVDGGLFDNYPLWLFDNCQFMSEFGSAVNSTGGMLTRSMAMVHNHETLGFRLLSPQEIADQSDQSSSPADQDQDIMTYLTKVVSSFSTFAKQNADHYKQLLDSDRTVCIDTGRFGLLKLNLSLDEKYELIEAGKRGARDFCSRVELN